MNSHIVRVNEKIDKIASIYNLSIDEIKKINTHISDWNNLLPGTKLRLPEISENLNNEIDNVEPFIEEYYPKIEKEQYLKKEEIIYEPQQTENVVNDQPLNKKKTNHVNLYNHPYPNYYPYYYNPYKRITNKNRKKPK